MGRSTNRPQVSYSATDMFDIDNGHSSALPVARLTWLVQPAYRPPRLPVAPTRNATEASIGPAAGMNREFD